MNIYREIQYILMELLDREEREITEESYLVRELGAESIDFLELAAALNARFRIEVNEDDIFLQGMQHRLTTDCPPFLSEQRQQEIAADLQNGPVIKVKDLVSYVGWQLEKAHHDFP